MIWDILLAPFGVLDDALVACGLVRPLPKITPHVPYEDTSAQDGDADLCTPQPAQVVRAPYREDYPPDGNVCATGYAFPATNAALDEGAALVVQALTRQADLLLSPRPSSGVVTAAKGWQASGVLRQVAYQALRNTRDPMAAGAAVALQVLTPVVDAACADVIRRNQEE